MFIQPAHRCCKTTIACTVVLSQYRLQDGTSKCSTTYPCDCHLTKPTSSVAHCLQTASAEAPARTAHGTVHMCRTWQAHVSAFVLLQNTQTSQWQIMVILAESTWRLSASAAVVAATTHNQRRCIQYGAALQACLSRQSFQYITKMQPAELVICPRIHGAHTCTALRYCISDLRTAACRSTSCLC
jgi:hypothetical protein